MGLKVTAKRLAAPIAAWTAGRQVHGDGILAPILCYHGVARRAVPEHVATAIFEKQMYVIAERNRCRPLTDIVERVAAVARTRPDVESTLALTFDDGYANLLECALPSLREFSLPATIFVVPGKVGQVADWPSPAPVNERRLLTLDEVERLRDAGLEIGAHGWTHIDLTACSAQQRSDEIGRCLEFLTDRLGISRPVFCYPWGRFDDGVAVDVRRAGFVAAVAGGWGWRHRRADLFSLSRVAVDWTDTISDFSWKLRGGYGWWTASWWRELRASHGSG
jgi:peptidoglycan/xylan/chitin deacetylase (PgdA/CDA1 family)